MNFVTYFMEWNFAEKLSSHIDFLMRFSTVSRWNGRLLPFSMTVKSILQDVQYPCLSSVKWLFVGRWWVGLKIMIIGILGVRGGGGWVLGGYGIWSICCFHRDFRGQIRRRCWFKSSIICKISRWEWFQSNLRASQERNSWGANNAKSYFGQGHGLQEQFWTELFCGRNYEQKVLVLTQVFLGDVETWWHTFSFWATK